MPTRTLSPHRPRLLIPLALAFAATLAGAPAGASDPAVIEPEPLSLDARLAQAEEELLALHSAYDALAAEHESLTLEKAELSQQLADLTEQDAVLAAANTELETEITTLTQERDRLASARIDLDELAVPLEADRLLLTDLRKQLPETRPEAEAHIERIMRNALVSDPVRLSRLVTRVRQAAPTYLDWRFTEFASSDEASAAFIQTGASAFAELDQELRNAILLTVANRIDGLLNLIERAD
jgi:DNA repair exonuclease SbcCD ATPase subunit